LPFTKSERVLFQLSFLLFIGGCFCCGGQSLYDTMERSKVKRTKADMLTIASAWESYAIDTNQYNAAGAAVIVPAGPYEPKSQPQVLSYTFGVEPLERLLVPKYIKRFPRVDGWGHEWQFSTDAPFRGDGRLRGTVYAIRSAGRNGTFDDPILAGNLKSFDYDLVYSNGVFINW